MHKRLFFIVLLFITLIHQESRSYSPIQAAIVVDAKSEEILYSHNGNCQTQPASLTKVMSLFIAFKFLRQGKVKPHTLMRVSRHAASQKPSSLKLRPGESITFHDAVLAMITKSANDVSVALAEHIGGTEQKFVQMMNQEAKRLRMTSTIFTNASGWKDAKQLTTAKDIARLSMALLREYPKLYHLFSTKKFIYKGHAYYNHNKLLGEKGGIRIDGIKTGFVYASGFNISVSATKGKNRLIVVVLGGKTAQKRNAEVEWLLSCAFNKLNKRKADIINKKASIPLENRDRPRIGPRVGARLRRKPTLRKRRSIQTILEHGTKY